MVHVWYGNDLFDIIHNTKGVFKGGGVKPPPKILRFFLKSEGKEVKKKRKKNEKKWGGRGVNSIVNIFFGD